MCRAVWKGPYVEPKILKNWNKVKKQSTILYLIVSRNSKIISKFVGFTFNIYNGKKYIKLNVTEKMIGHKFGEFSHTRTAFKLKQKNKNGTKN